MIVYTIHEPPDPPADKIDRAAGLKFVRDGFSLMAALLAPAWMIVHGLWLVFLGYLAMIAVIVAAGIAGLGLGWGLVLAAALHVIIGFEWSSLRRWTLERRGWRTVGTVTGRSAAECERRFFESWLPGEPFLAGDRRMASTHGLAVALGGVGLGERGFGERIAAEQGARERSAQRSGWRSLGWRRDT